MSLKKRKKKNTLPMNTDKISVSPSESEKTMFNKESLGSVLIGLILIVFLGYSTFNYFKKLNTNSPKGTKEETKNLINEEQSRKSSNIKHKVIPGEGLWNISEKYYKDGYKWVEIAKINNLSVPYTLYEGQILIIPKIEKIKGNINKEGTFTNSDKAITASRYKIVKGDHLWSIALRACGDGYKWVKIAKDNNLFEPNLIHTDNILFIKCK